MISDTHTLCVFLMIFFTNSFMIAYKHGNSDYIIDTTHPTSDDYLKFVEEAQASLKSGKTRFTSSHVHVTMLSTLDTGSAHLAQK